MSIRTAALAVALMGCATPEQVDELSKKVDALEEKVASLEARGAGGAAAVDPKKEEAAKKLYDEITALIQKGEMESAKTKASALEKEFGSTTVFKRARKLIAELEVVGKAVPTDWAQSIEKWYQGEGEVDLSSGTTLVVFWEVWCPHCRREVPELKATYESFKGKGLDVVGLTKITRSATEEKVLEFMKEQTVTYPTAKENGDLSKTFNVSGIPAAAVVKDGKIIWRGHPARLNDDMLTGWLGS